MNKEPREPMERKVLKVKLVPKEKRDLLDLQEIREMMEHLVCREQQDRPESLENLELMDHKEQLECLVMTETLDKREKLATEPQVIYLCILLNLKLQTMLFNVAHCAFVELHNWNSNDGVLCQFLMVTVFQR